MTAGGTGGAAEDADADGAARGRLRAAGRDVRTRAEARDGAEAKTRCQLAAPPYQVGEERSGRGASNSSLLGC